MISSVTVGFPPLPPSGNGSSNTGLWDNLLRDVVHRSAQSQSVSSILIDDVLSSVLGQRVFALCVVHARVGAR